MPRSDLTVQPITVAGVEPTYEAANGDGNAFLNRGRTFLHVKNGGGGPCTVTAITPITVGGRAVADDDFVIPASEERMIGPFSADIFNNSGADVNKVHVDYSTAASVTVAAFFLP